jgi:drug/metabolite transporter (DMT)-like permease
LPSIDSTPQRRRNAAIAVACATIIQVAGQLLIKRGVAELGEHASLIETAIGMVTILPLFSGFVLYGLFTVIMVFALRRAELSLLYPIMALSYVWVTVASVVLLKEAVNAPEIAGVAVIVCGVAVLGRGESVRA